MLRHQSLLKRRWLLLAALAALGALLLTPASYLPGGGTVSRHLEIPTLFAVSGAYTANQLPAQYGVDLVVSQAHLPDGYTLSVVHEDYSGALSQCKEVSSL